MARAHADQDTETVSGDGQETAPDADDVVATISRLAQDQGLTIAAAESLTSGGIATSLGAGEQASDWFKGAVVAYQPVVKFHVLGVDEGPVMTARCAEQMATGVRGLLEADLSVAITGVGGPGPEEDRPAGTVFIATCSQDRVTCEEYRFDGSPSEILDDSVLAALRQLAAELKARCSVAS